MDTPPGTHEPLYSSRDSPPSTVQPPRLEHCDRHIFVSSLLLPGKEASQSELLSICYFTYACGEARELVLRVSITVDFKVLSASVEGAGLLAGDDTPGTEITVSDSKGASGGEEEGGSDRAEHLE